MHLLFLSMSAHLTKELGMAPGGEFRTAFREVSINNAQFYYHKFVVRNKFKVNRLTIRANLFSLEWSFFEKECKKKS